MKLEGFAPYRKFIRGKTLKQLQVQVQITKRRSLRNKKGEEKK